MAHDPSIVVRRDSTDLFYPEGAVTDMPKNASDLIVNPEFHCEHGALLGPLGLFVQGLLAFIAFSALIVKRFCEPPHERRSWKIWFFDTSKQGIGAALLHFANVFLAGMFTGDPCTWYFISFMLDSTIGLLVIYLGLKISQMISIKKGWNHLLLGEYGKPPSAKAWLGQCLIYLLVMLVVKILMTLLVLFNFWKKVREFILSPIKNPKLELVLVMFIVPFIVNAFIFWVVDNFLKKKAFKISPQPSTINVGGDTGMKYFTAVETVKYYQRTEHADESESDVLLSLDEDGGEVRYSGRGQENGALLRDNSREDTEYRLLNTTEVT